MNKKTESQIMKEIEIAVSAEGHKIFRVNVGKGYLYRAQPTPATLSLENQRARWFSSGVPEGYTDLSGVCYPSGRALFIECKTPQGKPAIQQCQFILQMLAVGANAGIAHDVEEALKICNMTDDYRRWMGGYIHDWLARLRRCGQRSVARAE